MSFTAAALRSVWFFFFQAEDGIRDFHVTGVQTCALPISRLPEFGEEFFAERGLEVADALASARAALRAEHALDHLDVVIAPEREEFVVRDERLGQLELLVEIGRASCRERV